MASDKGTLQYVSIKTGQAIHLGGISVQSILGYYKINTDFGFQMMYCPSRDAMAIHQNTFACPHIFYCILRAINSFGRIGNP